MVDDDFRHLGQRLQALRREQGLTLEALAHDSGLSAGYLSQIENGQAVPSLTALQVIAASLGVEVATFFPDDGNATTRVVRAADRHAFRFEPQSGEEYAVLAQQVKDSCVLGRLRPPPPGAGALPFRHLGEEFALVLSGKLRLMIGEETREIGPGEWAHYSSQHGHAAEVRIGRASRGAVDPDPGDRMTTTDSSGPREHVDLRQPARAAGFGSAGASSASRSPTSRRPQGSRSATRRRSRRERLCLRCTVLARFAHALDLTLAEVLRASPSAKIAHGRIEAKPGTVRLVGAASRIQVWHTWQPAGAAGAFPFPLIGEDIFAFVDNGAVEIQVNGTRHELGRGDSIHCNAPRTVAWTATSKAGAGVVWVVGRTPVIRLTPRGKPLRPCGAHPSSSAVQTLVDGLNDQLVAPARARRSKTRSAIPTPYARRRARGAFEAIVSRQEKTHANPRHHHRRRGRDPHQPGHVHVRLGGTQRRTRRSQSTEATPNPPKNTTRRLKRPPLGGRCRVLCVQSASNTGSAARLSPCAKPGSLASWSRTTPTTAASAAQIVPPRNATW